MYGLKSTNEWVRRYEFRYRVEACVYAMQKLEEADFRFMLAEKEDVQDGELWWVEPLGGEDFGDEHIPPLAQTLAEIYEAAPVVEEVLELHPTNRTDEQTLYVNAIIATAYDRYREDAERRGE